MKSTSFLSTLGLLALRPEQALAFWRMACSVSQTARADPILNLGEVAGHAHKFAGGINVNENSTYESLQSSKCSTCQVQDDKSAYWTPQLYYSHGNGSVEEVPNDGMTVYYVGRGGDASNTRPFPPGFQMISGISVARSYDSATLTYQNTRPVADRVSFRCIDQANDLAEQHYMFRTDCVNGMRAQLNFQSCWDGQNLYLPNSTHVAYLSGIDNGVCPPSHPVPIPGLFFEVLYWTNRINQSGGGQFVFSNGDTTGYGFHGDFMNGWNMDIQTAAIKDCLYVDNGGVVSACPSLAASNDINFPRDCPQQPSVFNEPVHGMIDALPGCNPITSGPEDSFQEVCPVNSHTPDPSVSSSSSASSSLTASGPSSSSASPQTIPSSSSALLQPIPSSSPASVQSVSSSSPTSPDSTLNSSPASVQSVSSSSTTSLDSTFNSSPASVQSVSSSSSASLDSTFNSSPASVQSASSSSSTPPASSAVDPSLPMTESISSTSSTLSTTISSQSAGGIFVQLSSQNTTLDSPTSSSPLPATTNPAVVTSVLIGGVRGGYVTITLTEMVTVTVSLLGVSQTSSILTPPRAAVNQSVAATFDPPTSVTMPASTFTQPATTLTIPASTFLVMTEGVETTTTQTGYVVTLPGSTVIVPASIVIQPGTNATIFATNTTFTPSPSGSPPSGTSFNVSESNSTTFRPMQGSNATSPNTLYAPRTTIVFTTTTSYVTVYPTSTTVLNAGSITTPSVTRTILLITDESSAPSAAPTTFAAPTTGADSSPTTSTFSSATSFLNDAAACSLYSTFFPDGCPNPTDGATTTFFTIRGREVYHTDRRKGFWRWI